jgi:hypothetical protein
MKQNETHGKQGKHFTILFPNFCPRETQGKQKNPYKSECFPCFPCFPPKTHIYKTYTRKEAKKMQKTLSPDTIRETLNRLRRIRQRLQFASYHIRSDIRLFETIARDRRHHGPNNWHGEHASAAINEHFDALDALQAELLDVAEIITSEENATARAVTQ